MSGFMSMPPDPFRRIMNNAEEVTKNDIALPARALKTEILYRSKKEINDRYRMP